jgi:hypothetical protein
MGFGDCILRDRFTGELIRRVELAAREILERDPVRWALVSGRVIGVTG